AARSLSVGRRTGLRDRDRREARERAAVAGDILDRVLHSALRVEVEKSGRAVVLEADLAGVAVFLRPSRIGQAVVEDVRQASAERRGKLVEHRDAAVRALAACGDLVIVEIDLAGEGIVALVFGLEDLLGDGRFGGGLDAVSDSGLEMNQEDVQAVVPLDLV